ncbi:BMC domain-containing protein [Bacillus marasmi]|uniref:BMC domain-containing protein n=1 Tax=Bacillus marasmi TaxID=1926279 RepID=UPI0011C90100|nr:BMC domain-containing protein [Bacillus marasmi]
MYDAIGLIETNGVAISIKAADAMLKEAEVFIIKHETRDVALVTLLIGGSLSSVRMAIDVGKEIARAEGALYTAGLLANPNEDTDLFYQKEKNTRWVSL